MKKRILHLITGLWVGGTEMMLLKTLPQMQRVFDNRVCCINGRGPVGEKLERAGVQVYYLNAKRYLGLNAIREFRRIVKSCHPDILVTYLIHADLIGRILGRAFGVQKVVCSVRGRLPQPLYFPLFCLDGLTSFLVDRYHFNSSAIADMYHRYLRISERKITAIPNGVAPGHLLPTGAGVRVRKTLLGLPSDKKVIGCIANLRKQKGHEYLIEGFRRALSHRNDLILILVGDGAERDRIERHIQQMGISEHVFMLGKREDIPEILGLIDVFVLPTLSEGMSNALIEAMAAGKAVITTDIPENREIIEDRVTGILVSTRSAGAIESAIIELTSDDCLLKSLGTNARQRALASFSLDNVISGMSTFLASV